MAHICRYWPSRSTRYRTR